MIWKYLEQIVLFLKDLNWVQHWVSRIGLLKSIVNLQQLCLSEILLTVYNSRILPCLQYCSMIWDSIHSFHHFQASRKSCSDHKSPPCAHSYPLLKTLHNLNIFKIYKHQLSCFVFLHAAKLQPITLSFLFQIYLWFSQVLYQVKE